MLTKRHQRYCRCLPSTRVSPIVAQGSVHPDGQSLHTERSDSLDPEASAFSIPARRHVQPPQSQTPHQNVPSPSTVTMPEQRHFQPPERHIQLPERHFQSPQDQTPHQEMIARLSPDQPPSAKLTRKAIQEITIDIIKFRTMIEDIPYHPHELNECRKALMMLSDLLDKKFREESVQNAKE
ncbi:hypothetical protein EJ02DRAFT_453496, partial [Clathrospora elynae]